MRLLIIILLLLFAVTGFLWFSNTREKSSPPENPGAANQSESPDDSGQSHGMVEAARIFLEGLTPSQRQSATFEFEDEERKNWHYVPKSRQGITWEALSPEQREKAITLFKTALSEQGYQKTREIMELELVLRALENRPPDDRVRHPELYYLSIFGAPDPGEPWGWRFEGHHISFNFSAATGELAVTPAFLGSNPANVPSGPKKGQRILHMEEDLARQLMGKFSAEQLEKTIITDRAPRDIITGADREVALSKYEGLPLSEMNESQRRTFEQLIRVYFDNMKPSIALRQWQRLEKAGLDNLYFAWAGSLEPGQGHYYRIHGPTLLIEYDNTQNNANHIHTVWRDPANDFGEDLLKKHYETSGHH
jgi:hypothetical protein